MFPTLDAAPVAAPVSEVAPVVAPAAVAGGGVAVLPLLLGLAVLGGVSALLLGNDEGQTQISISP